MKLAVVVVLAWLASPARADQPRACSCASKRVLPASNAVDVPTNARFWRLPSRRPGEPIKPYELAAHTGFVLQDVSFTTGGGPDHEPPIAPSVAGASVSLLTAGARVRVSLLHVIAATSADTAVVHLHFSDALGNTDDYYTTPDQLSVCEPDIEATPGHLRLDVTALDLAGNESAPDTVELEATVDRLPSPHCSATAVAGATDDRANTAIGVLFALAGIGLFLARTNLRRRGRDRTMPEPFALPAVEQLVRAVRLRSLGVIMLCGIATSYALQDPAVIGYALVGSPLGALLLIDAVIRYIDAGRVRVLLHYDGVTADVRFDEVGVTVGKQRATVCAAPRLVERARHHALPRATL